MYWKVEEILAEISYLIIGRQVQMNVTFYPFPLLNSNLINFVPCLS